MSKPLTPRQQQIFDFICSEVATKGYPPSVREIASAVGLSSPSTVHTHLQVLEDRGYIKRDLSKPRALEITSPENAFSGTYSVDSGSSGADMNTVICLPIVGRVAAGKPILAEQNIEGSLPVPKALVGNRASFVLKVRGDSMVQAGIFDGDYVVVHEQANATNGQIIVAMIDDGATVKTFYREKEMIRLQPENPAYEPIYVRNPRILGSVIALLRTF